METTNTVANTMRKNRTRSQKVDGLGVYKMRIDENNSCRCGRCGHKLYELIGENAKIRIKCHSCKIINESF